MKVIELVSERSSNIYPLAVRFVSSVLASDNVEIAELAMQNDILQRFERVLESPSTEV